MNPVQKAIMDRRSTRGFESAPLTADEMQALIDAALQSPSAMNKQPWHFTFLTDKQIMKDYSEAFRQIMLENANDFMKQRLQDPAYDLFMGAPLCVFVTAENIPGAWTLGVDCGIAIENIAISAVGLGLGSVIVGMPRELFLSDRGEEFKIRMKIPENHEYFMAILVGRPTVTKEAHPILPDRYHII